MVHSQARLQVTDRRCRQPYASFILLQTRTVWTALPLVELASRPAEGSRFNDCPGGQSRPRHRRIADGKSRRSNSSTPSRRGRGRPFRRKHEFYHWLALPMAEGRVVEHRRPRREVCCRAISNPGLPVERHVCLYSPLSMAGAPPRHEMRTMNKIVLRVLVPSAAIARRPDRAKALHNGTFPITATDMTQSTEQILAMTIGQFRRWRPAGAAPRGSLEAPVGECRTTRPSTSTRAAGSRLHGGGAAGPATTGSPFRGRVTARLSCDGALVGSGMHPSTSSHAGRAADCRAFQFEGCPP